MADLIQQELQRFQRKVRRRRQPCILLGMAFSMSTRWPTSKTQVLPEIVVFVWPVSFGSLTCLGFKLHAVPGCCCLHASDERQGDLSPLLYLVTSGLQSAVTILDTRDPSL